MQQGPPDFVLLAESFPMWKGDYLFLLQNMVVKDFKIRYRNMSLGVFWSLLNPLILMSVMTFVFTILVPNNTIQNFPLFVLCGLVPFNFFTGAWNNGTICIDNNAGLIKRVPVPREVVPIATVLSTCIHLMIQIGLLLAMALFYGRGIHWNWLWLPIVWVLAIIFVIGIVLVTSALDVYVRDMRYVVESACTVLFWAIPIFYYPSPEIAARFSFVFDYNPITALVFALRIILIDGNAPPLSLLGKFALSSFGMFAIGWFVFRRLKSRFFDYL